MVGRELLSYLEQTKGRARNIKDMVEELRHCDDVLLQIAALKSEADALALLLLEDYLNRHIKAGIRIPPAEDRESKFAAMINVVRRFIRTSA